MFPCKLAPDFIVHIPREISRHVWFVMAKGAEVTARVIDTRPKRSPIMQGEVEILIMVNVEWDNADGIRTLKEKVESVNFPVGEDEEYKNDSNEILKSIGVEEESDSDSNM